MSLPRAKIDQNLIKMIDSALFKAHYRSVKGNLAAMFYCFYTKSTVKLNWIPECLLPVL